MLICRFSSVCLLFCFNVLLPQNQSSVHEIPVYGLWFMVYWGGGGGVSRRLNHKPARVYSRIKTQSLERIYQNPVTGSWNFLGWEISGYED